jgi:hypothetical protein
MWPTDWQSHCHSETTSPGSRKGETEKPKNPGNDGRYTYDVFFMTLGKTWVLDPMK